MKLIDIGFLNTGFFNWILDKFGVLVFSGYWVIDIINQLLVQK